MYKVQDVLTALDEQFPLATQDSWDNSGLLVGNAEAPLQGVLFCLDVSEEALDEAIRCGCNVVVSHHPAIFRGLKRLVGSSAEQRIVAKAIKNDVALVAFHTPADKAVGGTSWSLGRALGLSNMAVLVPDEGQLDKVVTYVPLAHADAVRNAMFQAGAGCIGNYGECSWNVEGLGTFRANESARPFVGSVGQLHREAEVRVEVVVPAHRSSAVADAVRSAHPYEEPAIDILPSKNTWQMCGYGVVGNLPCSLSALQFLQKLASVLDCRSIRHSRWDKEVARVAICTGSASEFVSNALAAGADAYVTADVKYHQMADADGRILVADVGHYESEIHTKMIFRDVLMRKLSNFANYVSFGESNPIKYFSV